MRKIIIFLIVLYILISLLYIVRNPVLELILKGYAKQGLGLDVSIEEIDLGIVNKYIWIQGLKVYNPSQFKDRVMIDVPLFYADFDAGSFFKKKIIIKEAGLYLKEFLVERNSEGILNLESIKTVRKERKDARILQSPNKEKEALDFNIKEFNLKIDRVICRDYSKGTKPREEILDVNIKETFSEITDFDEMVGLVLFKTVINTKIKNLTGFDLVGIKEDLSSILKTGKLLSDTAFGTVEGAGKIAKTIRTTLTNGIKGLLDTFKNPFDKDKKKTP